MNTISIPSSRPIDLSKTVLLRKVWSVLGNPESAPMLVGAFARDIWFWHLNEKDTIRRTEDIDISMAFQTWDHFREGSKALQNSGFTVPDPNCPEKLIEPETGLKLDLIPFGGLSEDGKTIVWYGDRRRWGIIGFEDSYNSAVFLPVGGHDEAIRVATLPAIVTLKMMSFYERPDERMKKDGADIGFIATEYLSVSPNTTRLMQGPDADLMDLVGGDILLAGCMLLGRDMARLAGDVTRSEVVLHLQQEIESPSKCPLAREVMKFTRGIFTKARRLLDHILSGYQSVCR